MFHNVQPPNEPAITATRPWRYGLLEACCSSPALTLDCALCFCCAMARESNVGNMGDNEKQGWVSSFQPGVQKCVESSGGLVTVGPIMYLVLCAIAPIIMPCALCIDDVPLFPCVFESSYREKVRKRHNIAESACVSKLTTLFCCPCAVMQTLRELESIGVWPGTTLFAAKPQVLDGWPAPPSVADVPGLAAAMQPPPSMRML
jgi:Cys-rich protein (TIGR01571 family)